MLAVDFFTVEMVWLRRLHVLLFLEIGSRCVDLAGNRVGPSVSMQPPSVFANFPFDLPPLSRGFETDGVPLNTNPA